MATGAQYDRLKKDTHDDERDDDISVADSHDTFAESHEPNATDAIVVVRRCRAPALRHSVQHAGSFAERHGTASCASHAATPSLATDLIESHTTQPALIPATPDYSTRSPEHSASQSVARVRPSAIRRGSCAGTEASRQQYEQPCYNCARRS